MDENDGMKSTRFEQVLEEMQERNNESGDKIWNDIDETSKESDRGPVDLQEGLLSQRVSFLS